MPDEVRFGGGVPLRAWLDFRLRQATSKLRQLTSGKNWVSFLEADFSKLTAAEEGKTLYGDMERGATLAQAWRTFGLVSGILPICLVADRDPRPMLEGIDQPVILAAHALVQTLEHGFFPGRPNPFVTFVYDGNVGHAITLLDYTGAAFVFHDPWPGKSLLCRENNSAGIDARRASGSQAWCITSGELERVVVAVFVFPTAWALMNGREYRVAVSDLQDSEFWNFFHISETGRVLTSDGGTRLSLQPGAFRDHISLMIEIDDSQLIRRAQLLLRREWVMEGGMNAFAADIAKSFITALTPEPDRKGVLRVVAAIAEIPNRERTLARVKDPRDRETAELLAVYFGGHPEKSILLTFATLEVANVEQGGNPWLSITIETN